MVCLQTLLYVSRILKYPVVEDKTIQEKLHASQVILVFTRIHVCLIPHHYLVCSLCFVLGYSQCLPSPTTSGSIGSSTTRSSSSTRTTSTSLSGNTTSTRTSSATSATGISTGIPRATLTEITNFGSNPTGVRAWLYVPTSLVATPPIIVGLHWCHGTANAFYAGTQFRYLADQKGFIVIYPQTPNSDGCWDIHTDATLTWVLSLYNCRLSNRFRFRHDAGGDSLGVVSAVRWTVANFNADTSRIFAVGTSSGAMMTNVLIGAYPGLCTTHITALSILTVLSDIFAAGSANAGVP